MSLQIGIIGGHGQMGRWFEAFFTQRGASVRVADRGTALTNEMLAKEKENHGLKFDRDLNDDQLGRIRETFVTIYSQWRALKPGESLTLPFSCI